jgi:hypothetical protein
MLQPRDGQVLTGKAEVKLFSCLHHVVHHLHPRFQRTSEVKVALTLESCAHVHS